MKLDYHKFRWFFTKSGKLVYGGKNSKQNEEICNNLEEDDFVLHTAEPGSPFVVIKNPTKEELQEAANFCASFSQQWKKEDQDKIIAVHAFKGWQVKKEEGMAEGSFMVNGRIRIIGAELKLWLTFQEKKLRAVPFKTEYLQLVPGNMEKEEAALKIQDYFEKKGKDVTLIEVLQAIPAGGIKIVGM